MRTSNSPCSPNCACKQLLSVKLHDLRIYPPEATAYRHAETITSSNRFFCDGINLDELEFPANTSEKRSTMANGACAKGSSISVEQGSRRLGCCIKFANLGDAKSVPETSPHIRSHTVAIDKAHLMLALFWMRRLRKEISAEFADILLKTALRIYQHKLSLFCV